MDKDTAFKILYDNILNTRTHCDYKRVTDLADDYKKYITGDNIESFLKRFNPREDEALFEQRKRLTIAITPAIFSSLKKPFNKVPRTQPVTRKILPKSDADKQAVEEVENRISSFYGAESNTGGLDYFLQNRFVDLSFTDPNAWIVVEYDDFDSNTTKPTPRPFIVSSHEAVDYCIHNNTVDWLIVKSTCQYKKLAPESVLKYTIENGAKYTIYTSDGAWVFHQVADDPAERICNCEGEPTGDIQDIEKIGTFIATYYEYQYDLAPCLRVGYIRDLKTKGRTFVNPFHDALCHFEKSIKQVSEYDLSTCLHTFPQKIIRITKTCQGEAGKGCNHGKTRDGQTCRVCNGTGKPLHTSGQDVVEVSMPDTDDENVVPLTDFVYYVPLPIELLQFQKDVADEAEVKCHRTVFGTTALIRSSGTTSGSTTESGDKTATEVDNNMESVYDTLAPFAEKVSSVWVTIVKIIATIMQDQDKVTIIHRFPSKFKLRTRQDLYNERKSLKDSGVPSFAISAVDDELAEDIFADDPEGLLRYRVKQDHFPWPGKDFDEIAAILASPLILKETVILYNYFDSIFRDLEREYLSDGNDFYLQKFAVRKDKIDQQVKMIKDLIDKETTVAFNINSLPSNEDNNGSR